MKRLLCLICLICPNIWGQTANLFPLSTNSYRIGTNNIYNYINGFTNLLPTTSYFVDVTKFGALADGTTDNQVAISNAWKSVAANQVLYFPPGVYKSKMLNLTTTKNNYLWYGLGATLKAYETNTWVLAIGGTNIVFNGLTIDADFKTYYGVLHNDGCQYVTYKDCTVQNTWVDNALDSGGINGSVGLYLGKSWRGFNIQNCKFQNIAFDSVGNVSRFCKAIFAGTTGSAATYCYDIGVRGCDFFNIGTTNTLEGDCISLQIINNAALTGTSQADVGANIVGNRFINYSRRGVKGYGDGWLVSGNTFKPYPNSTNNWGAISLYGARQNIIGNEIIGPVYRAIDSTSGGGLYSTNSLISGNYIHATSSFAAQASSGIYLEKCTNIVVQNNFIAGVLTNGMFISSEANTVYVRDNIIQGAVNNGIWLNTNAVDVTPPQNLFISRNNITGANYGILAPLATTVYLEQNRGTATTAFIDTTGATGVKRWNNGLPPAITTATLDFPSISAQSSADLTISVTGAATGDPVSLALPAAPTSGITFNAFVSAADTVTVRAYNFTGGSIDPASASYTVEVFKN